MIHKTRQCEHGDHQRLCQQDSNIVGLQFFRTGSEFCSVCERFRDTQRSRRGPAEAGARTDNFEPPQDWATLRGQLPIPPANEPPRTIEQLVLLANATSFIRYRSLGKRGLRLWEQLDTFATNEFAKGLEDGSVDFEALRDYVLVHKAVFLTESIAGKNEGARLKMFTQRASAWMASDGSGRERLLLQYVNRATQLLYEREMRRRQGSATALARSAEDDTTETEVERRAQDRLGKQIRDLEDRQGLKKIVSLLTAQVVMAPDTEETYLKARQTYFGASRDSLDRHRTASVDVSGDKFCFPFHRSGLMQMRAAFMQANSAAAGDLRGVGPDLPKRCLQAVTTKTAEECHWLRAHDRIFRVWADGKMPKRFKPVFEGGKFVPLIRPKEQDKLRAAVVPMVMTRAFGRRALEAVKEELLNILRRVGQVGVGVKGAVEAVVRMLQGKVTEIERDKEVSRIVVQDDLKNFFNEVSQLAIRDTIIERIPGLARLAKYLFEGPEHATVSYGLWQPLTKDVGVHMGSTLAAAFAALLLAHHVEKAEEARKEEVGLELAGRAPYDPHAELVFSQEDRAGQQAEEQAGAGSLPMGGDAYAEATGGTELQALANYVDDGTRVASWTAALSYLRYN